MTRPSQLPHPCEACGQTVTGRKYCDKSCADLVSQRKHRAAVKASLRATKCPPSAVLLAVDYQPVSPDVSLFCPPCYGNKPHRLTESGTYACRNCGRERLTPQQYAAQAAESDAR